MKILFLALLITVAAHADWITPKGKAYHPKRECIALRTTKQPTEITKEAAEKRGLHPCGICARNQKGAK